MRLGVQRAMIGGFVASALVLFGAVGLSGAGGQVWHVPRDYPTIQAAVDAAGEGDTILVAPGVYSEHVVVSTSRLRLRGAGPVSPVERPSASDGENVVLDGTSLGGLGIGIHVRGASAAEPVTGVEVSRFEVRNFERGINVEWAADTRVSHNYLHDNLLSVPVVLGDGYGIALTSASASDVGHNIISGNGVGAIFIGGILGSTDSTVHHNRVDENGIQACPVCRNGVGIFLTGPSNNTQIQFNDIDANNGDGVTISRPATQVPVTGILVAHNRLHANQRAGIAILGGATGNTVVHNDARDNNLSGLPPARRCDLFDDSVGRNGGNIWAKNLGTFGIPGDACAMP